MSINSKAYSPGALKKGNASGVKVTFKTKSEGHTFSGDVSTGGSGKMSHAGFQWMGFDMSNSLNNAGVHNVTMKRKQNLAGQAFNLSMGVNRTMGTRAADFTLGANTTFTKQLRGASHKIGMNNTVKFGVNLDPNDSGRFSYGGMTSKMSYQNEAGTFGTLLQLSSNKDNALFMEQLAWANKFGDHTFGVDTRWQAPSQLPDGEKVPDDYVEAPNAAYGFKSLTVYGQSQISDNWSVGMSVRPTMNMANFSQAGACSVGMTGKINDQMSMSGVTDGNTANVTATYKPNGNVDMQMTNEWDLNDVSQQGLHLAQLKPAFTINLHD